MVKFSKKAQQERRELLASMKAMNFENKHVNNNAVFDDLEENVQDKQVENGLKEIFFKELMETPNNETSDKIKHLLENTLPNLNPASSNANELVSDVTLSCKKIRTVEGVELISVLSKPHFKALISTHDEIAETVIESKQQPQITEMVNEETGEPIRMVGIRKKAGEPLGLTVQVDDNKNLVIARILEGGAIEKQGLLHVGDVILEVNRVPVFTPEDLQTEITRAKDSVTLKIGQSDVADNTHSALVANGVNGVNKILTCYMRALYQYDPQEDTLLPCKEIGLAFDRGDILQIVDRTDPNWWQAKKVGGDGATGLIPSMELEERRKAFVAPEADYVHKISICGARISKKKKKITYKSKSNSDFDKAELLLYEEVTRMPPFKRKTLVLIGTQGVGRRTLKNRLINSNPDKFGGVVPYTTRPQRVLEENGQSYWFTDTETIQEEIKNHKFLEYGEYNGYIYGTHLDSIRDVIKQGKMCVLDCSPAALKMLHNSTEFLPYVIFIASPGMEQLKVLYDVGRSNSNLRYSSRNLTFERQSSIRYSSRRARTLESLASLYEEEDLKRTLEDSASLQRTYDKYIDLVIVNNDFDTTFRQIIEAMEHLTTEHQWVPVNWIY